MTASRRMSAAQTVLTRHLIADIAAGSSVGNPARDLRRSSWRGGPLGVVDKFEPASGCGEMDHAEEAVCKLVVAGGDGAVDIDLSEQDRKSTRLNSSH